MNNDTFTQRIATAIRAHRKLAKLSQIDLAELAGVGKTVIFDIEHGKESIQLNTLLKVLRVLSIQLTFESKCSI